MRSRFQCRYSKPLSEDCLHLNANKELINKEIKAILTSRKIIHHVRLIWTGYFQNTTCTWSIVVMNNDNELPAILGDIVHRLNNPVGAIRIRIELFKSRREELLKTDEYLAQFIERTDRDLKIVVEIISELRESYKSKITPQSISIRETIALSLSKADIPNTVEVETRIDDTVPNVLADDRLTKVFWNLIDNALHAMSNKGKIIITARKAEGNFAEIDITDTGSGMSSEIQSGLFQSFISTKQDSAHGLGLWWTRTYLLSIGGEIKLVSTKLGEGTTFRVSLPLPNSEA